jgi:hypothetical protein
MNSLEIEDMKVTRCKCGEWLYAGNSCEVCTKRGKALL